MNVDKIKNLRWIECDSGTYIDDEQITCRYEIIATDYYNSSHFGLPYSPSEVYIMRINAEYPPIFNFPKTDFFGKELVWKCDMNLLDTWQEMRSGDSFIKDGLVNVYVPKPGVKLSDIFTFDIMT